MYTYQCFSYLVGIKRFELLRISPMVSKTTVSTNCTIFPLLFSLLFSLFHVLLRFTENGSYPRRLRPSKSLFLSKGPWLNKAGQTGTTLMTYFTKPKKPSKQHQNTAKLSSSSFSERTDVFAFPEWLGSSRIEFVEFFFNGWNSKHPKRQLTGPLSYRGSA